MAGMASVCCGVARTAQQGALLNMSANRFSEFLLESFWLVYTLVHSSILPSFSFDPPTALRRAGGFTVRCRAGA